MRRKIYTKISDRRPEKSYRHHRSAGTKPSPRQRFVAAVVDVDGGGGRFRRTFAQRTGIAQMWRKGVREK